MTDMGIRGLRLSFEYFGSPGTSGVSQLSIRKRATELEVTIIHDLTERHPDDEIVISIGPDRDWRAIVSAIKDDETACAFFTDGDTSGEFPWPHDMGFEGPRNVATELIALAWAGSPLSEFAADLASASDGQLRALRDKVGSFTNQPFVEQAIKIQKLAWETSTPLKSFLADRAASPPDLSAIQSELQDRFRKLFGEE